jgi:uncharacterized protein YndB with AHSA1/START domain
MDLLFSFDRTIDIRARPSTVFRFFTDPARFARWWGDGSTIEPVVGGKVSIRYPDGTTASGVIEELVAEQRIVFTYGYDAPGRSIPAGGSRVTITLHGVADGTRVDLRHDVADAKTRDEHVQGWRYVLALFANVASADAHAGAGDALAAWFTAWNEPSAERVRELLRGLVAPDVSFRDGNGCVSGLDELAGHIAACQKFMPGIRLELRGKVRQSHGTALADWAAVKPDGTAAITGTSVFRFAADGPITEVIGVAG